VSSCIKRRLAPMTAFVLSAFAGVLSLAADPATQPATAPAQSTFLPATIEPLEQADLYAKVAGYVTEVSVDIGDHVKAGQTLAATENPELESEIVAAEATLRAKREMANAAKASVEQSKTTQQVTRSQLAGHQADQKLAQSTLKRQEELFAAKAVTDQQLDDAKTRAVGAQTQVEVAQAKILASDSEVLVAQANQAVAEAQVGVAEAELKRLQTLVRYMKIVAPFDGVISRRLVNRGDLAQAGTAARTMPLFTIHRMDTVRIACEVPEAFAGRINNATRASIKVFGFGERAIDAKVTRFAGSLNPETRTMRTEIHVPNPDEKLRPGMYAQVTLTLAQ
jgi:multidrug efflux pump subunit AcrA (membrane-fusion protein)